MKHYAVLGTCPLCGQGRQILAVEDASQRSYVLCEDCEAEWMHPSEARQIEKATHGKFGRSTLITSEEAVDHPWKDFLIVS